MSNLYCTNGNILVKEFRDTESESGIVLGDDNSEPYSLYEILSINDSTVEELRAITTIEDISQWLLLYSGFARVPITGDKFIVHIKDCLGIIKKSEYKSLLED